MTEKKSRKESGFMKKCNLNHATLKFYDRALNANNIYLEEFWYQSVFHGGTSQGNSRSTIVQGRRSSLADNLTKEVFQRNLRGGVSTSHNSESLYVTSDFSEESSLENNHVERTISQEGNSSNAKSPVIKQDYLDYDRNEVATQRKIELYYLLEELLLYDSSEPMFKFLAFYLVKADLSSLFLDLDETSTLYKLKVFIEELGDSKTRTCDLQEFIGTRWLSDSLFRDLSDALQRNHTGQLKELNINVNKKKRRSRTKKTLEDTTNTKGE